MVWEQFYSSNIPNTVTLTVDKIVAVEKNEKKVTETGSVKKYRYLEKEVSSE